MGRRSILALVLSSDYSQAATEEDGAALVSPGSPSPEPAPAEHPRIRHRSTGRSPTSSYAGRGGSTSADTEVLVDDDEFGSPHHHSRSSYHHRSGPGDSRETDDSGHDRPVRRRMLFFATLFLFLLGLLLYIFSRKVKPRKAQECEPCEIIGTVESNLAQAILPTVGILVLLIAFYLEENRRTWQHWTADNAKQGISSACTHFTGTLMAVVLRDLVDWVDECDWYLMVFVCDTVLGCLLSIMMHRYTAIWASRVPALEPLSRIGDYEAKPCKLTGQRPPSTTKDRVYRWCAQVLHWCTCVVAARFVIFLILYLLHTPLGYIASFSGHWACSESEVRWKLSVNVVFIPMILDSIQFIVQNLWLKPKKPVNGAGGAGGGFGDGGGSGSNYTITNSSDSGHGNGSGRHLHHHHADDDAGDDDMGDGGGHNSSVQPFLFPEAEDAIPLQRLDRPHAARTPSPPSPSSIVTGTAANQHQRAFPFPSSSSSSTAATSPPRQRFDQTVVPLWTDNRDSNQAHDDNNNDDDDDDDEDVDLFEDRIASQRRRSSGTAAAPTSSRQHSNAGSRAASVPNSTQSSPRRPITADSQV